MPAANADTTKQQAVRLLVGEIQTRALMKAIEQAAVASRRDGARAELIRRASWLGAGPVAVGLTVFLVGFRVGGFRGEAAGQIGRDKNAVT